MPKQERKETTLFYKRTLFYAVVFFISISTANAQIHFSKEFKKLSCPEKRWVIFHPFIAKKSFRLTQQARAAAKEMTKDPLLDGDENGGQVDAFRHAYWMALLSQHICWRKARCLGRAHEKGNYREFKKHQLEEGMLPDSAAGAMDLFNNKVGIEIGRAAKKLPEEELKKAVRDSVLFGKMQMIRKNKNGEPVDCDGIKIDPQKYPHQWNIPKCLVKSDDRRY
jgi:hypothetical protein